MANLNISWIPTLAILAVLTGFTDASPAPNPGTAVKPNPTRAQSKTAPASRSDAELEKAIRARLAASKIAADRFEVHVQGGVATLEGQCDVIQHKGTATRLAKACGATSVVNKIRISQAARDKAAANLASGRRRAQVKRSDSAARSEARSETLSGR